MIEGKAGLVIACSILALLAVVGAAKAEDTAFAFHAPQETEGRPNYHFGPVKLAIRLAVFWGIAGFLPVGDP
jgi:cytochrome c oxidase cbb3-type subunit I